MNRRTLMVGGISGGLAVTLPRPSRALAPAIVLELFTSQGCSSCPPADALLGEYAKRPEVIALAWHVDYWNSLGWKDPYASRESTDRQRAYARQLRGEVYTPALVVNGAAMMVGSDRYSVHDAVRQAPALPIPVALRRVMGELEVDIGPLPGGPLPGTTMLVLAGYDADRSTAIGAGENAGRKLREYRIVRATRVSEAVAGRRKLQDFGAGQGVAALLQDADGRIRGAAQLRPG